MKKVENMKMDEMENILINLEEKVENGEELNKKDIKIIKEIEDRCSEGSWMSDFECRCWDLLGE